MLTTVAIPSYSIHVAHNALVAILLDAAVAELLRVYDADVEGVSAATHNLGAVAGAPKFASATRQSHTGGKPSAMKKQHTAKETAPTQTTSKSTNPEQPALGTRTPTASAKTGPAVGAPAPPPLLLGTSASFPTLLGPQTTTATMMTANPDATSSGTMKGASQPDTLFTPPLAGSRSVPGSSDIPGAPLSVTWIEETPVAPVSASAFNTTSNTTTAAAAPSAAAATSSAKAPASYAAALSQRKAPATSSSPAALFRDIPAPTAAASSVNVAADGGQQQMLAPSTGPLAVTTITTSSSSNQPKEQPTQKLSFAAALKGTSAVPANSGVTAVSSTTTTSVPLPAAAATPTQQFVETNPAKQRGHASFSSPSTSSSNDPTSTQQGSKQAAAPSTATASSTSAVAPPVSTATPIAALVATPVPTASATTAVEPASMSAQAPAPVLATTPATTPAPAGSTSIPDRAAASVPLSHVRFAGGERGAVRDPAARAKLAANLPAYLRAFVARMDPNVTKISPAVSTASLAGVVKHATWARLIARALRKTKAVELSGVDLARLSPRVFETVRMALSVRSDSSAEDQIDRALLRFQQVFITLRPDPAALAGVKRACDELSRLFTVLRVLNTPTVLTLNPAAYLPVVSAQFEYGIMFQATSTGVNTSSLHNVDAQLSTAVALGAASATGCMALTSNEANVWGWGGRYDVLLAQYTRASTAQSAHTLAGVTAVTCVEKLVEREVSQVMAASASSRVLNGCLLFSAKGDDLALRMAAAAQLWDRGVRAETSTSAGVSERGARNLCLQFGLRYLVIYPSQAYKDPGYVAAIASISSIASGGDAFGDGSVAYGSSLSSSITSSGGYSLSTNSAGAVGGGGHASAVQYSGMSSSTSASGIASSTSGSIASAPKGDVAALINSRATWQVKIIDLVEAMAPKPKVRGGASAGAGGSAALAGGSGGEGMGSYDVQASDVVSWLTARIAPRKAHWKEKELQIAEGVGRPLNATTDKSGNIANVNVTLLDPSNTIKSFAKAKLLLPAAKSLAPILGNANPMSYLCYAIDLPLSIIRPITNRFYRLLGNKKLNEATSTDLFVEAGVTVKSAKTLATTLMQAIVDAYTKPSHGDLRFVYIYSLLDHKADFVEL